MGWILPLKSHVTIACSGAAKAAAKAAVSQVVQHPTLGYLVRCGATAACANVGTELCRKQHAHTALRAGGQGGATRSKPGCCLGKQYSMA